MVGKSCICHQTPRWHGTGNVLSAGGDGGESENLSFPNRIPLDVQEKSFLAREKMRGEMRRWGCTRISLLEVAPTIKLAFTTAAIDLSFSAKKWILRKDFPSPLPPHRQQTGWKAEIVLKAASVHLIAYWISITVERVLFCFWIWCWQQQQQKKSAVES